MMLWMLMTMSAFAGHKRVACEYIGWVNYSSHAEVFDEMTKAAAVQMQPPPSEATIPPNGYMVIEAGGSTIEDGNAKNFEIVYTKDAQIIVREPQADKIPSPTTYQSGTWWGNTLLSRVPVDPPFMVSVIYAVGPRRCDVNVAADWSLTRHK